MKKMVLIILSVLLFSTVSLSVNADESNEATSAEDILKKSIDVMRELDSFKSEADFTINTTDKNMEIQSLIERDKLNTSLHEQTVNNGVKKREVYLNEGYIYWLDEEKGEFVKAELNKERVSNKISSFQRDPFSFSIDDMKLTIDSDRSDDTYYVIEGEEGLEEYINKFLESSDADLPKDVETDGQATFYIQKDTYYLDHVEMTIPGTTEEGKTINIFGVMRLKNLNHTEIIVPEDVLKAEEVNKISIIKEFKDKF